MEVPVEPRAEPPPTDAEPKDAGSRSRRPLVIGAVAAAVAIIVGVVVLSRGDSDGGTGETSLGNGGTSATTEATSGAGSGAVLSLSDFPSGWTEDDSPTSPLPVTGIRRGCTPAMEADDQASTSVFLDEGKTFAEVTANSWTFADADQADTGAGFLTAPSFGSCVESALQGVFQGQGATVGTPSRRPDQRATVGGAQLQHLRWVLPVTGGNGDTTLDAVIIRKDLSMALVLLHDSPEPVPDELQANLLAKVVARL